MPICPSPVDVELVPVSTQMTLSNYAWTYTEYQVAITPEAGLALDVVTDDEKRQATGGVAVARRAAVLSKVDRNIMLGELMV